MSKLLTMDLAALRARVSSATIQRYIRLGFLIVAKQGRRRQQFLDPAEVDRWVIWYKEHRRKVADARRRYARSLSLVNGMVGPGTLLCERQDSDDRERLFSAVYGDNLLAAKEALVELHEKYRGLRMPLEEKRLGIDLVGRGVLHEK